MPMPPDRVKPPPPELLILKRITFDNLENHNARSEEELACFLDDENEKAYAKLKRYLQELEPQQPYIGYDMEVYPQFRVERRHPR